MGIAPQAPGATQTSSPFQPQRQASANRSIQIRHIPDLKKIFVGGHGQTTRRTIGRITPSPINGGRTVPGLLNQGERHHPSQLTGRQVGNGAGQPVSAITAAGSWQYADQAGLMLALIKLSG